MALEDDMNFLKKTIIGGVFFLVPVVALGLVIGKAYGFMMVIAEPMARIIPIDAVGGIALANLLAMGIIVLMCFAAGLLAYTDAAQRAIGNLETKILQKVPGYNFLKGLTNTLNPEEADELKPVLVSLDSRSRIGLQVEELEDNQIAVYFPSSPNAWSGIVQIVRAEQVRYIDAPIMQVIEQAEQFGRGMQKIVRA